MGDPDPNTKAKSGAVVTKRISPRIIESVYTGHMTANLVGVVRKQLGPCLYAGSQIDWLVNLEAVTGIELAPSSDSSGFYAWFRAGGGERIAIVVRSSMVRMVISALAFAVGTSLQVFETREKAVAFLQAPRG